MHHGRYPPAPRAGDPAARAPGADGEPRAAVLRPGLPPLAFASVREAVTEANAREARR